MQEIVGLKIGKSTLFFSLFTKKGGNFPFFAAKLKGEKNEIVSNKFHKKK